MFALHRFPLALRCLMFTLVLVRALSRSLSRSLARSLAAWWLILLSMANLVCVCVCVCVCVGGGLLAAIWVWGDQLLAPSSVGPGGRANEVREEGGGTERKYRGRCAGKASKTLTICLSMS